jgi:hypothetical protein
VLWFWSLVAITALWVAGVLVPYYVNDLDRLPLDELSSGAYDPKDLWPYAGGSSFVKSLRGPLLLVTLPLLPVLGLGSAAAGAIILTRRRQSLHAAAGRLTVAALVLALVMIAVSLSPFGLALRAWALD